MSKSETYTKTFGTLTRGVTVEALPVAGVVMEHPFDSSRGGGYGRKHRTRFPALKARSIGRRLKREGYERSDS